MKPGATRVTMKDVAEAAGLSQAAISMALRDHPRISEDQRARVHEICRKLGYRNPRAGSTRRPSQLRRLRRIGFIYIGGAALPPILSHVVNRAQEDRVRVEIFCEPDAADTGRIHRHILDFCRPLDGVLLTDCVRPALLADLGKARTAFVVLGPVMVGRGEAIPQSLVRSVTSDEVAMGRHAVHCLASRGHHRIGFISGEIIAGLYNARWLDGFHLAHTDLRRAPGPVLTIRRERMGINRTRDLQAFALPRDAPSGFVIPDAHLARHLADSMSYRERQLPPDALVVGDLADRVSRFGLDPYTAINPDFDAMAAQALHYLARQFSGDETARGELIVPFRVSGPIFKDSPLHGR